MDTITYATARQKLAATMDRVVADHAPVLITRTGSEPVVLLSLADYESMEETAYLLSSPNNAARLLESIRALEDGQGIAHDVSLLDK
jgi:antitoxin YefM